MSARESTTVLVHLLAHARPVSFTGGKSELTAAIWKAFGSSGINGTSIIIFINEWAGHRKSRGMGGRGQRHTYSSLQPRTIVRIRTCINEWAKHVHIGGVV